MFKKDAYLLNSFYFINKAVCSQYKLLARAVLLKLPAMATEEAIEQFKRAVAHKELINPQYFYIKLPTVQASNYLFW